MPIDWSDKIILAELSDEPELAEELAAIFERLKVPATQPQGAERLTAPPGAAGPPRAPECDDMPSVVLNFSAVTYLNSSHIASLLRMRKQIMECGRSLVLCNLGDELWTMIGLTGLDKVFQFAPDTMTALARVQLADERGGRDA